VGLVNSLLEFNLYPESQVPFPVRAKALSFATFLSVSNLNVKLRKPSHRVTLSMGHPDASRKSIDAPWEMLSLRLSREISAPLLMAVLSWRHGGEDFVGAPLSHVLVLVKY